MLGNPAFTSERLLGYEAGYRSTLTTAFYLDVAAFHNRHEKLETFGAASLVVDATPAPLHAAIVLPYANGADGASNGVELVPTWRPLSSWQLRGFYSYLNINLRLNPGFTDVTSVETYERSSPRHQIQLQSSLDLPAGWEFDVTMRHVSALPARGVAAYTSADVYVGWRRGDRFLLSLAGANLLDASHAEFGHDPPPTVGIRRSVAVTATWSTK